MARMYHLELDEDAIRGARVALLPGDPARSALIAARIAATYGGPPPGRPVAQKREYCTHVADIAGTKVVVTSTGIGGPSTSIAVDELAQLGVDTFIRVGTTGGIQDAIAIGDVIVTTASVRLDGASVHFAPLPYPAVAHHEVLFALIAAARGVAADVSCRAHVGITASTDTFYQGQDRPGPAWRYVPRDLRGMADEWRRLHVLNFEMESSTLLTMASAFGLRAGCVTGVINTRGTDQAGEPITAEHLRLGEDHAVRVAIKAVELMTASRTGR
ncbi:MAG: uridine phosphorylase [Candidatus Rokubacteria bacterium]|nr:uridine phosphorylase [Candidatus Rokubacteria bacterium]